MQREEIQVKAKERIDEIFQTIDMLESRKDRAEGKAREEYDRILDGLITRKAELQHTFNKMVDSSGEKLEEVNETFTDAADSFKEGFSKLTALLN